MLTWACLPQMKQEIHFELRIFIMCKSKIALINSQALPVYFISIRSAMAIATQCDQILV